MGLITLTVTAHNGRPADTVLQASFDETGGLIGRADSNQMVLPDPDRSISRVHAQIVFRNGRYAVIDRGSNAIQVNGRSAGNDKEMPLHDGDQIQIGGYDIAVKLGAALPPAGTGTGFGTGTSPDPFADIADFADLTGPAPARAAGAPGTAALPDPLADFGSTAMPLRAPAAAPPAPWAGGVGFAAIPEDWNPFAPSASPAPAAAAGGPLFGAPPAAQRAAPNALGLDLGAAAPAALIPDLAGSGGSESLDALFGLGPAQTGAGADPFAQSALAQPMAQPNMAAHADPLKSLNSAARASGETQRDTMSDLSRPFVAAPVAGGPGPAVASSAVPGPGSALSRSAVPSPGSAMPGSAVLSWDESAVDGQTVIRPGEAAAAPWAAPLTAPTPAPVPVPMRAAPPAAARVVAAPVHAHVVASVMAPVTAPLHAPEAPTPPAHAALPSADVAALLAAFRSGLGSPDLKLDALTPELMQLVGTLLREAVAGTVDMLLARATLKRELHADNTVIRARDNNPLKFSPTAEAALQHLLAPPVRGYMAPAPALRDAYTDLRAHQFGMVVGLRAALEGVLDRFDPAALEGRLTQRSALQSLLPGSRKARLWDVFVEHYGQIRSEASDDFHALFGKAFVEAYEGHVAQIDRGER